MNVTSHILKTSRDIGKQAAVRTDRQTDRPAGRAESAALPQPDCLRVLCVYPPEHSRMAVVCRNYASKSQIWPFRDVKGSKEGEQTKRHGALVDPCRGARGAMMGAKPVPAGKKGRQLLKLMGKRITLKALNFCRSHINEHYIVERLGGKQGCRRAQYGVVV